MASDFKNASDIGDKLEFGLFCETATIIVPCPNYLPNISGKVKSSSEKVQFTHTPSALRLEPTSRVIASNLD